MNHELIKRLGEAATQTLRDWDYYNGNKVEFRLDREKFAELIVRECVEICRDRKLTPSVFTADELLEHFGIAEE